LDLENGQVPEEDDLRRYLKAIARIPPLSKEEEDELWNAFRSGDQRASDSAKKRLIESQLSLVISLARRYQDSGLALVRLIEVGNEGLIRALGRFDQSSEFRFSTFGSWWIRQAITRAIADHGQA
jgi:RNA polymerase primary sigma factor